MGRRQPVPVADVTEARRGPRNSGVHDRVALTGPHGLASSRSFLEASLRQGISALVSRSEDPALQGLGRLCAKALETVAPAVRTQ